MIKKNEKFRLDFKAEWNKLEDERKKISEQQAQISTKQQQGNDEMRRIQQDIQSISKINFLVNNYL